MTTPDLGAEVVRVGARLHEEAGAARLLREQLEDARSAVTRLRREQALLEHVVGLLGAIQETWRRRFEQAVSEIVSPGISEVFGEELTLVVELVTQGDLPAAKFRAASPMPARA